MEKLKLSDNTAKLHQMFGKKLYADKYSFISEICQNAVDSHRMSGQKDPVIVGLRNDGNDNVFYVKDTGLSFDSKEDFVKKICTILESGKLEEKTNDETCAMGMHGIGSISVSAFRPEWSYKVVKDGREFIAVLKEVEGVGLTYDLSDYRETDEEKNVLFEVRFPNDIYVHEFIDNMKSKLCYFKDFMFEFDAYMIGFNKRLLTLNTEFKLFQTDDMQISTLSTNRVMHICLDQYYYPINWERIKINPIPMNIGLRFHLADGLVPDITRENLMYSDNYAKVIEDKIRTVANWFVKRYNDGLPDELTSIKRYMKEMEPDKAVEIEGTSYTITNIVKHSTLPIKPLKFKGVDHVVLSRFQHFTDGGKGFFNFTGQIGNKGNKISKGSYWSFRQYTLILVDKPMSTRLSAYVKKNHIGAGLYSKAKISLSRGEMCYKNILGLSPSNKSLWREKIQKMQILEKSFEEDFFIKSSQIVIPDTFTLGPKKTAVRKDKVDLENMWGEVGVKYAKAMEKSHADWDCKFEEKTLKIRDLYKQPFMHVYGNEKDRTKLDILYRLTSQGPNKIAPCMLSDRQQGYIKQLNLHNFMHVDDFLAGKHRLLKSIVTAYLINNFITKYKNVFSYRAAIENYLCSKFAEDMLALQDFSSKYMRHYTGASVTFMNELVKYAVSHKLYDLEIWERYKRVKAEISKFDFVEYLVTYGGAGPRTEAALQIMHDVAKYRAIKMDWKYYKMEFNDRKTT